MTEKKQRNTKQRRVILDELRKVTSHPTASDVYEMVRPILPSVSLGTVYRNLELLAQNGEVLKLETGGESARYDGSTHTHYHIRCVECGRVDDLHTLPADAVGKEYDNLAGYVGVEAKTEFFGVCPGCQRKN